MQTMTLYTQSQKRKSVQTTAAPPPPTLQYTTHTPTHVNNNENAHQTQCPNDEVARYALAQQLQPLGLANGAKLVTQQDNIRVFRDLLETNAFWEACMYLLTHNDDEFSAKTLNSTNTANYTMLVFRTRQAFLIMAFNESYIPSGMQPAATEFALAQNASSIVDTWTAIWERVPACDTNTVDGKTNHFLVLVATFAQKMTMYEQCYEAFMLKAIAFNIEIAKTCMEVIQLEKNKHSDGSYAKQCYSFAMMHDDLMEIQMDLHSQKSQITNVLKLAQNGTTKKAPYPLVHPLNIDSFSMWKRPTPHWLQTISPAHALHEQKIAPFFQLSAANIYRYNDNACVRIRTLTTVSYWTLRNTLGWNALQLLDATMQNIFSDTLYIATTLNLPSAPQLLSTQMNGTKDMMMQQQSRYNTLDEYVRMISAMFNVIQEALPVCGNTRYSSMCNTEIQLQADYLINNLRHVTQQLATNEDDPTILQSVTNAFVKAMQCIYDLIGECKLHIAQSLTHSSPPMNSVLAITRSFKMYNHAECAHKDAMLRHWIKKTMYSMLEKDCNCFSQPTLINEYIAEVNMTTIVSLLAIRPVNLPWQSIPDTLEWDFHRIHYANNLLNSASIVLGITTDFILHADNTEKQTCVQSCLAAIRYCHSVILTQSTAKVVEAVFTQLRAYPVHVNKMAYPLQTEWLDSPVTSTIRKKLLQIILDCFNNKLTRNSCTDNSSGVFALIPSITGAILEIMTPTLQLLRRVAVTHLMENNAIISFSVIQTLKDLGFAENEQNNDTHQAAQ